MKKIFFMLAVMASAITASYTSANVGIHAKNCKQALDFANHSSAAKTCSASVECKPVKNIHDLKCKLNKHTPHFQIFVDIIQANCARANQKITYNWMKCTSVTNRLMNDNGHLTNY